MSRKLSPEERARLLKYLSQFFRPNTLLFPATACKRAGVNPSLLSAFKGGHRGRPKPSTLVRLVPHLRAAALQAGHPEIAKRATAVRILVEAGYLPERAVAELIKNEGGGEIEEKLEKEQAGVG